MDTLNITWQGIGRYKMFHIGQAPSIRAKLDIPTNSKIAYACWCWSGDSLIFDKTDNNNIVEFIDSMNNIYEVSDADSQYSYNGEVIFRGIDGTEIIKNATIGNYTVNNIPQGKFTENLGAGWWLLVVCENSNFPYSQVICYNGLWDFTKSLVVENLITPTIGNIEGRFFIAALNGKKDYIGEELYINKKLISGPNNPSNNFFSSQINDYKGNKIANTSEGYFDITNVDISNGITNGDTSIELTYNPGAEWIYGNTLAFEIQLNQGSPTITKNVDKLIVTKDDIITYTIIISNNGSTSIMEPTLINTIPTNMTYINENKSILKNIQPNEKITITYSVKVNEITKNEIIESKTYLNYKFSPLNNSNYIFDSVVSNTELIETFIDRTEVEERVCSCCTTEGQVIKYSVIIDNFHSPYELNDVYFVNTIANNGEYLPSTLEINGYNLGRNTLNKETLIGNLKSNSINTITFEILVTEEEGVVSNISNIIYSIRIKETTIRKSKLTNMVASRLLCTKPIMFKSVDKEFVTQNEILIYTVTIANYGDVTIVNGIFVNTMPYGMLYMPKSSSINGTSVPGDVTEGLTIPDIGINEILTIQYNARVI